MIRLSKRFFIWLAIFLIVLGVLAPTVTYSYLSRTYGAVINSDSNMEKKLQQQVDSLKLQNKQLENENSQLTNLTQPHLITSLGWYLHKSTDPVQSSRNTFTVYGTIYNIGNLPANNVELKVEFYGTNQTLLQTSTINLGIIPSVFNSTTPYTMDNHNIDCSQADLITSENISLHYQ